MVITSAILIPHPFLKHFMILLRVPLGLSTKPVVLKTWFLQAIGTPWSELLAVDETASGVAASPHLHLQSVPGLRRSLLPPLVVTLPLEWSHLGFLLGTEQWHSMLLNG